MNRESKALSLAGLILGLLALSATAAARLRPAAGQSTETRSTREELVAVLATESAPDSSEAASGAPDAEPAPEQTPSEEAAGPFPVSLRVTEPVLGERLFVCDGLLCPLEELEPDGRGEAVLGPLAPGRYALCRGQTAVGSFRLRADGRLDEAEGRLWTDGTRLYLERFEPGALRLSVRVDRPGYYVIQLRDRNGRRWSRDLYLAEPAAPDEAGGWTRELELGGLRPGLYTVVWQNSPLAQAEVRAGQTGQARVQLGQAP